MSRLWALSDLHVNHRGNLAALAQLRTFPDDGLLLVGDVGDGPEHLRQALDVLVPRFGAVMWVPGNHELWAVGEGASRGVARYHELVEVCRARGVRTPEDPWPVWETPEGPHRLCLMFLLYDYSFAPDGMGPAEAIAWAAEDRIQCVDEQLLHTDPYPSAAAWCAARVQSTQRRLDALDPAEKTVLINHWPLRRDQVRLPNIPRFAPWCGTRATEDWPRRYRASVVVSGHLHVRATDWRDGVRYEEVSLGYPRHWTQDKGAGAYLRQILPTPSGDTGIRRWRADRGVFA